jgi:hypothetical protein
MQKNTFFYILNSQSKQQQQQHNTALLTCNQGAQFSRKKQLAMKNESGAPGKAKKEPQKGNQSKANLFGSPAKDKHGLRRGRGKSYKRTGTLVSLVYKNYGRRASQGLRRKEGSSSL